MARPCAPSRTLLAAAGLVAALFARAADVVAYERQLRGIVSDSRERVVSALGMAPGSLLSVKIHSRAGYERLFGSGAAHLDAARLAGEAVHVNGGTRLDDRFAGVVVHEMVHAALDARGTAWALPRWLDEGLAERLSWKRRGLEAPAPSQVAELKQARDRKELVPLPRAGKLSRQGYLQAWAAVVFLEERFGRERLMATVRRTLGGEPFERVLRRECSLSPEDLDRAFE